MKYEIDEFEKYEELLVGRVGEGEIGLFRTYLSYKKEVIENFRKMIFGLPLLEQKDAISLAHCYFYYYIRGLTLTLNNDEENQFVMKYPPEVELITKQANGSSSDISDRIQYLRETINSRWNSTCKAISDCFRIIDPNFVEIGEIPFEDLHLPECFRSMLVSEDDGQFGLLSASTQILLQCIIFFDYFKIPLDSEADVMFYDLWREFFDNARGFSIKFDKTADGINMLYYVVQPWQADEVVNINGQEISKKDIENF